jgi:hypothetical protein
MRSIGKPEKRYPRHHHQFLLLVVIRFARIERKYKAFGFKSKEFFMQDLMAKAKKWEMRGRIKW